MALQYKIPTSAITHFHSQLTTLQPKPTNRKVNLRSGLRDGDFHGRVIEAVVLKGSSRILDNEQSRTMRLSTLISNWHSERLSYPVDKTMNSLPTNPCREIKSIACTDLGRGMGLESGGYTSAL